MRTKLFRYPFHFAMQTIAMAIVFGLACNVVWAIPGFKLKFDSEEVDPDAGNPYDLMASMNSWTVPILDHTGQPHRNGNIIQIIADGGNGIQDPPNPDGTPGGDDSLAYGNFNLMRVVGLVDISDTTSRTGLFFSQLYFIPYQPGKAYYLRLWEGKDYATAPYYQDTVEYSVGEVERGGAMVILRPSRPADIDWRFGEPKPRPQASKPK